MAKIKRDGERFARIPQSVLECEAVATLNGAAFKIMVLLALGARAPKPDNRKDRGSNGVQAFTFTYARRFGFTSKDTLQRALQELLERGLIIKTRAGWRLKNHFALYGVGWLPITHRDGKPLEVPEPPIDAWRTWCASAPVVGDQAPKRTKKLRPDSRAQTAPIVGAGGHICAPILSVPGTFCAPIVGDTSRLLGGTRRGSPHSDAAPAPQSFLTSPQNMGGLAQREAPGPRDLQ